MAFWRDASCSLATAMIWAPSELSKSISLVSLRQLSMPEDCHKNMYSHLTSPSIPLQHLCGFSEGTRCYPVYYSSCWKNTASLNSQKGGWFVYSFSLLVHGRAYTGRLVSWRPMQCAGSSLPPSSYSCPACSWFLWGKCLYMLLNSSRSSPTARIVCLARLASQDRILSVPFCFGEMAVCAFLLFPGDLRVALWAHQGCMSGTSLPTVFFCPTDTPTMLWITWAVMKQRITMEVWWASSPLF